MVTNSTAPLVIDPEYMCSFVHLFILLFVCSVIHLKFSECLLCASILLGADIKLSCKEINMVIQIILRAMKYPGIK